MKLQDDTNLSGSQSERLAAIREQGRLANLRRKNRQDIWCGIVIGGFCILAAVGVVLYLDSSKRSRPPANREAGKVTVAAEKITVPVVEAIPAPRPEAAKVSPPVLETPAEEPVAEVAEAPAPAKGEGLADEPPMVLVGMEAGRDQAKQRDEEILARAIRGEDWAGYRELLGKSVAAALPEISLGEGIKRFTPIWEEPLLDRALLRWQTLGRLPQAVAAPAALDTPGAEFLTWLLNDPEAMQEFLMTIRPEDDAEKVLDFLIYAWTSNKETYRKYYPLALACAVVFDEPMGIPHALGEFDSGTSAQVDPVERYLWYVTNNEKGKLAAPVDRSSARDLVWVVCAPVVTSELDWSLKKMQLRRNTWGKAYGMIEYLMERAVDGVNPYEEYSLEQILEEGGICGDQTYFTINSARAQGIPAIGLSGETSLGGHAWAALKVNEREWDTGIGRIGGVSKGQAQDPQTRRSITEQEIQLWNDRHHQSAAVTLAVWRHLWLADFFRAYPKGDEKAAAIHVANRIGRTFLETWAAMYNLLEEQTGMVGTPPKPGNLEDWKGFESDMRREFKENPRIAQLAAKAEMEYIFPYGSANDAKTAFIRDRRRILSESGEQIDLIAESLKRESDLMIKRGDPDAKSEISQLYDGALRDYGSNITGFKMMAGDYFGFFRDDPEQAAKAARDIELAFKRVVETGTKEWFRASTETSIYKMICGYYREAGDTERAELLEDRYEVLMKRAERAAD